MVNLKEIRPDIPFRSTTVLPPTIYHTVSMLPVEEPASWIDSLPVLFGRSQNFWYVSHQWVFQSRLLWLSPTWKFYTWNVEVSPLVCLPCHTLASSLQLLYHHMSTQALTAHCQLHVQTIIMLVNSMPSDQDSYDRPWYINSKWTDHHWNGLLPLERPLVKVWCPSVYTSSNGLCALQLVPAIGFCKAIWKMSIDVFASFCAQVLA